MAKPRKPKNNRSASAAAKAGVDEAVKEAEMASSDAVEGLEDAPVVLSEDTPKAEGSLETALADEPENDIDASKDTTSGNEIDKNEPDEPAQSEPSEEKVEEPARAAYTPTPVPAQTVGFWPVVFGGVVAALLGFLAGRSDQLDAYLPSSMQRTEVDLTEIETRTAVLAGQATDLTEQTQAMTEQATALTGRVDVLESVAPVEVDPALGDAVAGLQIAVDEIAKRLLTLEDRPVVAANDTPSATPEELAALQVALDAQRAEIAALAQQAQAAEDAANEAAAKTLARAALTRVVTAVDSGESFKTALSDLEDVTPVEVPEPLRAAADIGVPTMASLQDSFPKAARAGLAAARSETPEADVSSVGAFLRRQLNARSVLPREGSDPDAILSRAGAAIKSGALVDALNEMDALSEGARTAMQSWLDAARARVAAQEAADALADSLSVN